MESHPSGSRAGCEEGHDAVRTMPLLAQEGLPAALLLAGHDEAALPARARRAVEPAQPLSVRRHLHVHWVDPDRSEPLRQPAAPLWRSHDGPVQGCRLRGAVTACVCYRRLCLPPDAQREQGAIHPGALGVPARAHRPWECCMHARQITARSRPHGGPPLACRAAEGVPELHAEPDHPMLPRRSAGSRVPARRRPASSS
jgi:hypothetical protein